MSNDIVIDDNTLFYVLNYGYHDCRSPHKYKDNYGVEIDKSYYTDYLKDMIDAGVSKVFITFQDLLEFYKQNPIHPGFNHTGEFGWENKNQLSLDEIRMILDIYYSYKDIR
jgi:hypothetical protein